MHKFLSDQGFKKLDPKTIGLDRAVELIYGLRVDEGGNALSLRICTGIVPGQDSRDVGVDAIRVSIHTKNAEGKVFTIGTARRVHRVEGWKQNLQDRIDNWTKAIEFCTCGKIMTERKGQHGLFLGCIGYPECKETRNV